MKNQTPYDDTRKNDEALLSAFKINLHSEASEAPQKNALISQEQAFLAKSALSAAYTNITPRDFTNINPLAAGPMLTNTPQEKVNMSASTETAENLHRNDDGITATETPKNNTKMLPLACVPASNPPAVDDFISPL